MPELPDVTVYIEALRSRISGQPLLRMRLASPFVLRTVLPPITEAAGKMVREITRLGKRIVLHLDGGQCLVVHLMIAGRLHWRPLATGLKGKMNLAALDFPHGVLLLTEASQKKRASLHFVKDADSLRLLDRGGLEVLDCSLADFAQALTVENHTLKRALTDPRSFSGIGNAYSDEILHRARLSPVTLTQKLNAEEIARLYRSVQEVLREWIDRLRLQAGAEFPENVTAFRPEMAVHGKFGKPCPVCGAKVQRIRYADNETNYCPICQTGGKLLADRSLSMLLRKDWPRTAEELEELRGPLRDALRDKPTR